MKRAQTELLGVVVIVLLLVVAGTFLLVNSMKNNNTDASSYVDPELAHRMLHALMNTKTEKNVIVADIIEDCYSNRNDLCGSATTDDCCSYAEATMSKALEETLKKWGRIYRLTVKRGSEQPKIPEIPESSTCNDKAEKEQPGTYYIPTYPTIVITLEICKN